MRKLSWALLACLVFSQFSVSPSIAQTASDGRCSETIFALTTGNALISFSSESPGTIITANQITGILPGEIIVGIDYRPALGEIFALSNLGRLYIVDSTTGFARLTNTLFVNLSGSRFGIDFNPVPDRMRIVSDADQNLRANVEAGVTNVDGTLAFAAGDVNAAADPNVVSVAYSNNFAGTTATTLYGIDSNLDILVIQNPPNNGTLTTVGSLGVNTTELVGFDIASGSTRAFASLTAPGSSTSGLYRINLVTGAASLVGSIGGGQLIRDLTIAPRRGLTVFAVTTSNRLLTFNSNSPGVILSSRRIRGMADGESILGIDFRPANGKLYGLGSSSRIYVINPSNAKATPVDAPVPRLSLPFTPALSGINFGFDFNPVPDRIRVTSDLGQDLRINPDTGVVAAVDGTLAFAAGDLNANQNPRVVGSAYANNLAGVTATTLYDIDSDRDALLIQNPPNNGTLTTVGSLGVDATGFTGFDIKGCDAAGYAALLLSGESVSKFFRIDLATGRAVLVGTIGSGEVIQDIAIQ